MIIYLIGSLFLLIISCVIFSFVFFKRGFGKGILSGIKIQKDEFRKHITQGKGKYGIVIFYNYNTVLFVIEVEELECAGDLTKVRVMNICSNAGNKQTDDEILEAKSFNEWIDTKKITWFSDNSQRLRDEKIKELLGEDIVKHD